MPGVFALGLIRAWELLSVYRYGFFGWLNPLQDVNIAEPHSDADTLEAASMPPKASEAASHPPS